jgi:cyclopropane fatty-acyl-phospholipid synthase-like methyltransferase
MAIHSDAASVARSAGAHSGRVPLKLRLKAWWEGSDVVVQAQDKPAALPKQPRQAVGFRDPARPWETSKSLVLQALWGNGFSHPGGLEFAIYIAKPFALNAAMTVIDLSAGLGGGTRAVAEKFDVWVTGLEEDEQLATVGMELSNLAGMGKKAPISRYEPQKFEFKPGSCDCMIARELFFRIVDKRRLFAQIAEGLKHGGQIVFTDFAMRDGKSALHPAIIEWMKAETPNPAPWSVEDVSVVLRGAKLESRVNEDISDQYRSMAVGAWSAYAKHVNGAIGPEEATCLTDAMELWAKRIAAIDSGELRVCRVHALKGSGKMLSNW